MTMSHILIISLGPIQDFIASARRCRDLWFGSWLLSELSKAVAKGVCDSVKIDNLVFPGVKAEKDLAAGSDTSVANKIVAIVREPLEPENVAEAGKQALNARLKELATTIFNGVQDREEYAQWGEFFQRKTAVAQIKDMIEFMWVSVTFQHDSEYPMARKNAEELLAQRKRTLLWDLPKWNSEPGIPKSSLDGQRESVIHEDVFTLAKRNSTLEGRLRRVYGVKLNERLCGVDLLKRLGERKKDGGAHQFLSTPHLATGPLLQRIKNEAEKSDRITQHWRGYLGRLNQLARDEPIEQTAARNHLVLEHYDGMLLHENRLEEWFEHLPNDPRNNERQKAFSHAQHALRDFFTATKLPRPLPYFAVLMADGDHMGKAIEKRDSVKDHQELSQDLDVFAQEARKIVEGKYDGELIYSGGDDVLAFVPLNHAIECAQALKQDFAGRLEKYKHPEGTPSLSVGIAICHFMDPMGDAFKLARQAEKKAKEKRNSLAIIADKRSGPATVISGIWGTVDEQILQFAEWHRNDDIPDGVAFELQELNTLIHGAAQKDVADLQALIRKETERILNRKRAQKGEKEIDTGIRRDLLAVPKELPERLIVARLIADAKNIAEGEPSERKNEKNKEGT
jgi:CRISPR-associated protein Cmr2